MTTNDPRFVAAAARLAARHREDPKGEALDHARAVSRWVEQLRPDASPALQLAARAAHIGRWRFPRDTYPANRAGYLRWRAELQVHHAEQTAQILAECGYDQAFADRVRALMMKQRLAEDPEAQTLEDALCLAFMERQLPEFATRHAEPKLQRILDLAEDEPGRARRRAGGCRTRGLVERSI